MTVAGYRLLVTGTRNDLSARQVDYVIHRILAHCGGQDPVVLVHGACRTGVDQVCVRLGRDPRYPHISHEPHPADWATYGKPAGMIRNQQMVDLGADECVGFPAQRHSPGTIGCMRAARRADIPTTPYLIRNES